MHLFYLYWHTFLKLITLQKNKKITQYVCFSIWMEWNLWQIIFHTFDVKYFNLTCPGGANFTNHWHFSFFSSFPSVFLSFWPVPFTVCYIFLFFYKMNWSDHQAMRHKVISGDVYIMRMYEHMNVWALSLLFNQCQTFLFNNPVLCFPFYCVILDYV